MPGMGMLKYTVAPEHDVTEVWGGPNRSW